MENQSKVKSVQDENKKSVPLLRTKLDPKLIRYRAAKGTEGMDIASRQLSLMTGSKTVQHEMKLCVTDYFDYQNGPDPVAEPVENYWWELGQNLFQSTLVSADGEGFSRPTRVRVWAMPLRAIENINSDQFFTVNAVVPCVGFEQSSTAKYAHVEVTNIIPTFTNSWKRVLDYSIDETFKSSEMRPYISGEVQNLFQILVTNPDTGVTLPDVSIQFKVEIDLAQPVAARSFAHLETKRSASFESPGSPGTLTDQYIQCDIRKALNRL